MTSPIEQNVPDLFQEEIDLPGPGISASKTKKARATYKKAIAKEDALEARRKSLQKKAHKTKSKPARVRLQLRAKAARKVEVRAEKAQTKARGAYYQVSGQYDKLLKGPNRDAYMALKSLFTTYGLGSLTPKIYDYVKHGYGADTIGLLLQDTKEYKQRFAGNEARAKAGLPVLAPADYLSAESAYRQILRSAGLPKGFYDNPADFEHWIAKDVSPAEIKSRVDMAAAATHQANTEYKHALFQMYGINEADLTAYFLDRKRAEPILKKQAAAGAIGAAAIRRGFVPNTLDLEGYATLGITADQAEQAYAQIADSFETMLGIAGRYGTGWSQREAEQEIFTPGAASSVGKESAFEKGKRLKSQERALFSGAKGSSIQGLNAGFGQT